MNLKKKVVGDYVSPAVEIINFDSEAVLCASDPTPWYKQGGQGDFDYEVTDEISWM